MPFDPVDSRLDLVALEDRVLAQWRERDVFAESLRRRAGAPEWVFYEGPPTANGKPGIHHVWARLFKDIYPRFHTMRGKYVARKAGWDCHGLPVEVEVEKELGFSGKPQIEDYGIEAFNRRCRDSVQRYVEDWSAMTARIGMWLDLSDAYTTMSNPFIESVWWQFHEMWDKELIYEGSKVVPYCGRCGTALSSHELGQPGAYRDITEDSVYVRFPVVDADFDLLVWTTTPWTLVSNVAAAVGPDVPYVRVAVDDGRDLVLAATRVEAVLGNDVTIVSELRASELVGLRYERPFDWLPVDPDAPDGWRVVAADFVTVDDGSGIVHLAPAFGEIDREVAEANDLPMLNPVNAQARFDAAVPMVGGQFVKDADPTLIDELRERNRLVVVAPYAHSYPHCWRCGTPLIYWAKPTWFARTSQLKETLLAENEKIGWHPEHIRHGRFGDWLANNVDWALSRDRFWGTPIPVWRCTDCEHDTCVGSVAELAERAGTDLADLDLHRPFVDDVTIACEACGGRARRVEPVLDAWFDSGSMPAAQWHYPFENREIFERRFPADFICEAIDQTRGWFYSLLAVNTLVFGRAPYRDVVCLALLLDQEGQKMSKSKGNVVDPWSVFDTRGADALRWNFAYASSPWTPKRVYLENIDETTNRFLVTLWNTYVFFVTYANLDRWEPTAPIAPASAPHVMDRWIRSRLHSTVQETTDALEAFDALRATQALDALVDDLSNWYVRRSRPRFWKNADGSAHAALHECLVLITQMLAPICPFVADALFQNLAGTDDSVHLCDWPTADPTAIDVALEAEMALARELVSLGLAARAESKLKVRQPLPRAIALVTDDIVISASTAAEISDALNVKALETVSSLEGLLDYAVLPNFRALGPKVGKQLPRVKELLATVDGAEVRRALESEGVYTLDVDGTPVVLTADDLQIRASSHEELVLAQDGNHAVAIDTRLTDELRREGLAREVVRALNDARKAADFAIADRIAVQIDPGDALGGAVAEYRDWIAGEVLAVELTVGPVTTPSTELTIDGASIPVRLTRRD